MKRGFEVYFFLVLVLILSLSIVSAFSFGDFFRQFFSKTQFGPGEDVETISIPYYDKLDSKEGWQTEGDVRAVSSYGNILSSIFGGKFLAFVYSSESGCPGCLRPIAKKVIIIPETGKYKLCANVANLAGASQGNLCLGSTCKTTPSPGWQNYNWQNYCTDEVSFTQGDQPTIYMDSYGRTHQFGWDELSLELLVPTPTSCTDSDGGFDIFVRGTCTDSFGGNMADGIIISDGDNNGWLREVSCVDRGNGLRCQMDDYQCPNGYSVVDGACMVSPTTCTDSDGGLDYYIQGTTTDSSTSKTDNCFNDGTNRLAEYYCTETNIAEQINYICPNGCQDGACVVETPISYVIEQDIGNFKYMQTFTDDDCGLIYDLNCNIYVADYNYIPGGIWESNVGVEVHGYKIGSETFISSMEALAKTEGFNAPNYEERNGNNYAVLERDNAGFTGFIDYIIAWYAGDKLIALLLEDVDVGAVSETDLEKLFDAYLEKYSSDFVIPSSQCTTDADCPGTTEQMYCDANGNSCVPKIEYTCDILTGTCMKIGSEGCGSCPNGCDANTGRCIGGVVACADNTCKLGDRCIPFGFRIEGQYCEIDNDIEKQKIEGSSCENNYECGSNQCTNGVCRDTGGDIKEQSQFFKKLGCRILNVVTFGVYDYEQCVAGEGLEPPAPTLEGDRYLFEQASTKLTLGRRLTDIKSTPLDDTEMPNFLRETFLIDDEGNKFGYTQNIAVGPNLLFSEFSDMDYKDGEQTIGIRIPKNEIVMEYSLKFKNSPNRRDLVGGSSIYLFATEYKGGSFSSDSISLIDLQGNEISLHDDGAVVFNHELSEDLWANIGRNGEEIMSISITWRNSNELFVTEESTIVFPLTNGPRLEYEGMVYPEGDEPYGKVYLSSL